MSYTKRYLEELYGLQEEMKMTDEEFKDWLEQQGNLPMVDEMLKRMAERDTALENIKQLLDTFYAHKHLYDDVRGIKKDKKEGL